MIKINLLEPKMLGVAVELAVDDPTSFMPGVPTKRWAWVDFPKRRRAPKPERTLVEMDENYGERSRQTQREQESFEYHYGKPPSETKRGKKF